MTFDAKISPQHFHLALETRSPLKALTRPVSVPAKIRNLRCVHAIQIRSVFPATSSHGDTFVFGECSFLSARFLFSAKQRRRRVRELPLYAKARDALRVGIGSLLDDSNYLNYATETMPLSQQLSGLVEQIHRRESASKVNRSTVPRPLRTLRPCVELIV